MRSVSGGVDQHVVDVEVVVDRLRAQARAAPAWHRARSGRATRVASARRSASPMCASRPRTLSARWRSQGSAQRRRPDGRSRAQREVEPGQHARQVLLLQRLCAALRARAGPAGRLKTRATRGRPSPGSHNERRPRPRASGTMRCTGSARRPSRDVQQRLGLEVRATSGVFARVRDLQHEALAGQRRFQAVVAVALAGQRPHLALDAAAAQRERAHPFGVEFGRAFAQDFRIVEPVRCRHAAPAKPRSALARLGPRSSDR